MSQLEVEMILRIEWARCPVLDSEKKNWAMVIVERGNIDLVFFLYIREKD